MSNASVAEFVLQHGVELRTSATSGSIGKGIAQESFAKWGIKKCLLRTAVKRGLLRETYVMTKSGLKKVYYVPSQVGTSEAPGAEGLGYEEFPGASLKDAATTQSEKPALG